MRLLDLSREEIFKAMNLGDLSAREKTKIWPSLSRIFETRILDFVLSSLSFEDQKEFIRLSGKDEKEAWRYLERKMGNPKEKIEEQVLQIREELLAEIGGLR